MRTNVSTIRHGNAAVLVHPDQEDTKFVLRLEALPAGRRLTAPDGRHFIRTNLICYGFCDLATGELCSARDICAQHGRCVVKGQSSSDGRAAATLRHH